MNLDSNKLEIFFPENTPDYEYDPDIVSLNIRDTRCGGYPELELGNERFTAKTAYIIGGGPTLKDEIGDGRPRLQAMDDITDEAVLKVLTGSAHRLLDQNVLRSGAHISVFNAPGPASADTIEQAHKGVEYWPASQCDPAVFAKMGPGTEINIWHAHVPELDFSGITETVVGGGTTAPTAAVALLLLQGCKSFEFFGVDGGNFDYAPNEYAAYEMDDILARPDLQKALQENLLVELSDGRRITVAAHFWSQAQEMRRLMEAAGPESSFVFHGESLNNLLFNKGLDAKVIYDPRKPKQAEPATRLTLL